MMLDVVYLWGFVAELGNSHEAVDVLLPSICSGHAKFYIQDTVQLL